MDNLMLPIQGASKAKRIKWGPAQNAISWSYMKLLRENNKTRVIYPVNPYVEVYTLRKNLFGLFTHNLDGGGDVWMFLTVGPEKALLIDTAYGLGDLKGLPMKFGQIVSYLELDLPEQMRGLLTNLDLTATGLGRSIGRVDRILADGKVDGVFEGVRTTLDETRQGIAETRQLVSEVGGQIKNLQIGETTARMNRLLDGLDRRTRVLTADVESTTDEIRLAAEHLRLLIDRLRDNPSDLIFSSPRGGETKEGR